MTLRKSGEIIKSLFARLKCLDNLIELKETLRNLAIALDFYLSFTKNIGQVVMLRERPTDKDIFDHTSILVFVALEFEEIAKRSFKMASKKYDPFALLDLFIKFELTRMSTLMIWSGIIPLNLDIATLNKTASRDNYVLAQILWVADLFASNEIHPTL